MNARAKALYNLYQRGKIQKTGLKQAVLDGIILPQEYQQITGEPYVAE